MTLVERVIRSAGRTTRLTRHPVGIPLRRVVSSRARASPRHHHISPDSVSWKVRTNPLQAKSRPGALSSIGAGSIVDASGSRGVKLGRGAKIGRRSIVTTTSQLGKRGVGFTIGAFSGIGDYAHIGCSGGVTIGVT